MAVETTVLQAGVETSEYKVAQSVKLWSVILAVLGLVDSVGSSIAAGFGADTKAGIIVGAVIAVAAIISKTLVSLGYSKARADVKAAIAAPLPPPELQ